MKAFYIFLALFLIVFGIAAVYCMIAYMPAVFHGSPVYYACIAFVAFLTIYAGIKCLVKEIGRKE